MKIVILSLLSLSCHLVLIHSLRRGFDPLLEFMKAKRTRNMEILDEMTWENIGSDNFERYSPVYLAPQDGLKEADKINKLPGQPQGVNFNQYAGYVTVDREAGRALFYYFVESPENPATKPLVLWLNGGPGCSSLGNGAMLELGPFRVKKDGKSLYKNEYAWNKVANVIFLESPAGVGFSYSNRTSDYTLSGDMRTAQDSYTFMMNWLERFPEYKTRKFFITGESYAGHYVPQLAYTILQRNKLTKQTVINLHGIAIGNALIDDETHLRGMFDYFWTHALISDEAISGIRSHCNYSDISPSRACIRYLEVAYTDIGAIDLYNIYAPSCYSLSQLKKKNTEVFDPCSDEYVEMYLNLPQVQQALHANLTGLPYPWTSCNFNITLGWKDSPTTILPIIQGLMASGVSVWIYSGDIDGRIPVTSSRYSINALHLPVKTPWYPWYFEEEVGGYAVGYKNLTFVTIREAGHLVPSYQPGRALTFFSYFLKGKLPPKIFP